MSGEERREKIINTLKSSDSPISGSELAKILGVTFVSISKYWV